VGVCDGMKFIFHKAEVYTKGRRPEAHDHSTEAGQTPVVVYDLHGTLTPSPGFLDDGEMLPPFEGVREELDDLVSHGTCIHVTTTALHPDQSPEILAARRKLIDAWIVRYGLPIAFVTGKVHAHVYYDDRMVPMVNGDFRAASLKVRRRLEKRFTLDAKGIWRRRDIPEAGHKFDFPDPDTVPPDRPRGLTGPILDVDMHRCVSQASSSKLEAEPRPDAVRILRQLYDAGITIHLSCAGWDPATHTAKVSAERLAGLRQWARKHGIAYDAFASKDHGDFFVDDRGITHTEWERDLPQIWRALTPNTILKADLRALLHQRERVNKDLFYLLDEDLIGAPPVTAAELDSQVKHLQKRLAHLDAAVDAERLAQARRRVLN
jgi:hypothetical protein